MWCRFIGPAKTLSPKYFYDATGSDLFEAICELDEYYPTRTETALLTGIAPEQIADIPDDAVLVEFGSGASDKTRLVLDAAPQIADYVPIDISEEPCVMPQCGAQAELPEAVGDAGGGRLHLAVHTAQSPEGRPLVGFFPGSTIGNFTHDRGRCLSAHRARLGQNARLILGADMVKDESTLVAAYDDAEGVTAQLQQEPADAHQSRTEWRFRPRGLRSSGGLESGL